MKMQVFGWGDYEESAKAQEEINALLNSGVEVLQTHQTSESDNTWITVWYKPKQ
jgi:hypothetical protein